MRTRETKTIRYFRLKTVAILSIAFFVMLTLLLCNVGYMYMKSNRYDIEQQLVMEMVYGHENMSFAMSENNESEEVPSEGTDFSEGPEGSEIPKENGTFRGGGLQESTVVRREDGAFTVKKLPESGNFTEEEAIALAEEIFADKKTSGTYGNYMYIFDNVDKALCLAYVDISEEIRKENDYYRRLVFLGLGVQLIFSLFAWVLSNWLVKPFENAMENQSDFVLSAGHELKTPMTVIKTSLELMEKEGITSKYLGYAKTENERMSYLVTKLLDLSKIENGQERIRKEKINLSDCIEGAVLPFEAMAYENGADMSCDIQSKIYAMADAEKITELVGILTDNAIKHTEEGKEIAIKLHCDGKHAVLDVKNQGDPIDDEDREKIFEKFYRVDKARNRDEGRYGLGLAIAKEIAKNHDASIEVDCKDGWTTFSATFKVL
ncbi:MAG: HAMP domain-containing histidine kinase [Lachnospiraceae bacterium]|nr:HAMP domain-containing histidine kinase [Lachnospiraceae bacterium]